MKRLAGLLIMSLMLCSLLSVAIQAEMRTDIEFAKPGGFSLTLDAFVPEGKGPFPTVIIVHGGGFNKGDKQSLKPLFEPFSQAGFTWFTINYRLFPQDHFPAPIEDVESAIRWVKAHAREYKVDPTRLVLLGESAGGALVSYVATSNKPATRVAAVVIFYGVHDWGLRAQQERDGKIGPSIWREVFVVPDDNSPAYLKRVREISAITQVSKGLPPFLLIHGTLDKQVNYQQSVVMQQRMKQAGNTCDLITVEGGEHGMGVFTKFPETPVKMFAWLRTTLKIS